MRRALAAACALGALLAVAPVAQGAYLERQERKDGVLRVAYWEMVPLVPAPAAQDVTLRVRGEGIPELTGDSVGAQRVEVVDTRSDVSAGTGCAGAASFGTCTGSPTTQATWRTSECYYPPGCTGPGPSGLIESVYVQLWNDATFRDDADSTPIPLEVRVEGDHGATATFASTAPIQFHGNAGPDRAQLTASTVGGAWLDGAGGDDVLDARNGDADVVACGAGADAVQADAVDDVRADCESVTR